MSFLHEAKEAFEDNPLLETYRNEDDTLIALRMGIDRDCVDVYEIDSHIANFVRQLDPARLPRGEVRMLSFEMERQLGINERKGHWRREHWEFLKRELNRNCHTLAIQLMKEDHDKDEITKRCANIANFAMMIADNYGMLGAGE